MRLIVFIKGRKQQSQTENNLQYCLQYNKVRGCQCKSSAVLGCLTFCHRFLGFRETKCETTSAVDGWVKGVRAT